MAAKGFAASRGPLAISLGLHVASFFALIYAPPLSLSVPQPSPTEYQQAFAGKEDKIVWYKFRDLPDVTPPKVASEPPTAARRGQGEAGHRFLAEKRSETQSGGPDAVADYRPPAARSAEPDRRKAAAKDIHDAAGFGETG